MKYKKILFVVAAALAVAILTTNNLVEAVNLNQAADTLPQNEEWSIMAHAAMGQNMGQSFLATPLNSSIATDYEKRILAITAIGSDPQTISSENFVSKLENMFDGTQIGDPNLLNDDIFGVLALVSAGIADNTVSQSRQFILSHQNSDHGWGYGVGVGSDSNTTAMAVAALVATGSAPNSAIGYLSQSQATSGGFGFAPGQAADGASTAWVISGLISAGQNVPTEAKTFLENLQLPDGSFKWRASDNSGSALVTAYAVIALSGHGLPVRTVSSAPPPVPTPDPNPLPAPAPMPIPEPVPAPLPAPVPNPILLPQPTPTPDPIPVPATPLPTPPVPVTTAPIIAYSAQAIHITITYPGNQIFVGDVNYSSSATALSALTTAAAQINLLYQIKQTGLGQFVQSIDGYGTSGTSGWQYAVDGIVPATGAADFSLHDGDNVQWFYGAPGTNPY